MALRVLGIVCHVSASRWGDARAVDSWHRQRGWSGIGYHIVLLNGCRTSSLAYSHTLDGKIEPGRPEDEVGAHCLAGGMNTCSLGVCCIGNPGWAPEGEPANPEAIERAYLTLRQESALIHTLAANCRQYGLDPQGTFTHRGRKVDVISQHSDHDPGKPVCASLKLDYFREKVAERMKGG